MLGFSVWWCIAPEQLLLKPATLGALDPKELFRIATDTRFQAIQSVFRLFRGKQGRSLLFAKQPYPDVNWPLACDEEDIFECDTESSSFVSRGWKQSLSQDVLPRVVKGIVQKSSSFLFMLLASVVSFGEDTTGSTTKEALSFLIIGHYLTVSKWKAEFRPSTASINLVVIERGDGALLPALLSFHPFTPLLVTSSFSIPHFQVIDRTSHPRTPISSFYPFLFLFLSNNILFKDNVRILIINIILIE